MVIFSTHTITIMKQGHPQSPSIIVYLLAGVILLFSIYYCTTTLDMIDQPFPGFLTFENGVVGPYMRVDWTGAEAGLRYHDVVQKSSNGWIVNDTFTTIPHMTFTHIDFARVFLVPFISGLLFLSISLFVYRAARNLTGVLPFTLFYLGVSSYLISSFDFHSAHTASWAFMIIFAFIPSFMTHFALVYPHLPPRLEHHRKFYIHIPYLISFILCIPYLYLFYTEPSSWKYAEMAVVGYAILSYLFWLGMFLYRIKTTTNAFDRITVKYLFGGQLLAFITPLIAIVIIYSFRFQIPMNLLTPLTLALPIASIIGIVWANLKKAQLRLIQSEKLASLGQLVAGVAHEINNPTNFIYSNIDTLKEYLTYIQGFLPEDGKKFRDTLSPQEVMSDLVETINDIEEGSVRIKEIVGDLRRFVYSKEGDTTPVDINAGIESTLHLLKHEITDSVEISWVKRELPQLTGNQGNINQVWMNLIKNGIDALDGRGRITIVTAANQSEITISISDTGPGIPEHIAERIFDPFFTTKPEGEGTGLGLPITYQIIKNIGGQLDITSNETGTTATVRLPL
jgi:signal transduction histidine kinase